LGNGANQKFAPFFFRGWHRAAGCAQQFLFHYMGTKLKPLLLAEICKEVLNNHCMKKTFLTIAITAFLTWFTFDVIQAVQTAVEHLWLVSAIKAPGKMAIADIQKDMNEGRYDLAKTKLQLFMDTWKRFDGGPDSCSGRGIGDVLLEFSKVDTNSATDNQLAPSRAAK